MNTWQEWISGFCDIAGFEKKHISKLIHYMITEDLFWNDQGILWFGRKGEQEYGRRNFMEILSVVAGERLFTVKHGSNDIGFVHPSLFFNPQGDQATVLLSGRSWRVIHVGWTQKIAYVEPIKSPGRSRWLGSAISLGYDVCQSMCNLLEGDMISPRWSKRAAQKITDIRNSKGWIKSGETIFVTDGMTTRWWTFAGDNLNRSLSLFLKENFNIEANSDSISILIRCRLQLSDIESIINKLRVQCEKLDELPLEDDLFIGFKFSKCIPMDLKRRMIINRLIDPKELEKIISSPYKIVSAESTKM